MGLRLWQVEVFGDHRMHNALIVVKLQKYKLMIASSSLSKTQYDKIVG
jgi:hypothetical protein